MVEDAESEVARMKVITIIEDGERARSVYVRADGDVTVFDRDRKFRFRCDIAGAETTWQIMARVTPHVVAAEARAIEIGRWPTAAGRDGFPSPKRSTPTCRSGRSAARRSAWTYCATRTTRSSWSIPGQRS